MDDVSNYVGGELVPPLGAARLPCFEPATGAVYAQVPDSDATDVDRAVQAAQRAWPGWVALGAEGRALLLRRLAAAIEARLEVLARAESIDTGKPLTLARRLDIPRAAANFRFFADAATQVASEAHVTDDTALNYTLRQSLGVVACISPWNLPLYLLTWKVAPALAAGNTVVAKPSEVTPMTAHLLAQLCREVGLPPGVLNIVHGLGPKVGEALTQHPGIRAISFTGSTRTGAQIARVAAPAFKKLSLELGGKNPNVVFADAPFDAALDGTVRAAFTNQGQVCLCGSRIFVERPIYDRFVGALTERVRQLRVGDPLEPSTDQGALVSLQHHEKVLQYLDLARQEGGRFLTGGRSVQLPGRCAGGWFCEPTLVEDLAPSCRTNQEEIFGPVATVMPFDHEDEVLAACNGTPYGLAATVWTNHLARAHRFAARVESGIVWVNCWMLRDLRTPFGGVKSSGVGREGGSEALRFFTEPKNVCIKMESES